MYAWLQNLDRRWIFLLMFLAVALPILFQLHVPETTTDLSQAVFDQIEKLKPGDKILIGSQELVLLGGRDNAMRETASLPAKLTMPKLAAIADIMPPIPTVTEATEPPAATSLPMAVTSSGLFSSFAQLGMLSSTRRWAT